ncbi:MAG: AbrB/MazE/SpoVT family DNA-binding domain-containing protein [Proteobacteria bacterium]|nr:AbrB/MazE/SpoVT family DNA-binding domain-containing protein [Pseudomonadota bacterium]
MRITSKGQVTIPAEMRERTGLMPETEVDFIQEANGVRIVKRTKKGKKLSRGEKLVARLRGTGDIKMTSDQIMALTRGR